jgi:transcriptional regulator with XRE-family HTH domain
MRTKVNARRQTETARTIAQVVSERVKEVRTSQRLSQDELASRMGTYRVLVQRTEKGTREVTVRDLFSFAVALGVSPLQLLLPRNPGDLVRIAEDRDPFQTATIRPWVKGEAALDRDSASRFLAEMTNEVPVVDEQETSADSTRKSAS